MPGENHALESLVRGVLATGYAFTPPTPETHRRVNSRPGNATAQDLAGIFGWSRPFARGVLPDAPWAIATQAGAVEQADHGQGLWRSRYRIATLAGMAFLHSAYPTIAPDSVFFGPDTYRFARVLTASLPALKRPERAVDIGCGAGVGGMLVARHAPGAEIILADINPAALRLSRINAASAGLGGLSFVQSDLLAGVTGDVDLIVANPPYMADPQGRAYRNGGGELGEGLSLRIVGEATARLRPGGTLLLYTGTAIIGGRNLFLDRATPMLTSAKLDWHAEEIDPDVFGEELEPDAAMHAAERIAVIWLTATKPLLGNSHA